MSNESIVITDPKETEAIKSAAKSPTATDVLVSGAVIWKPGLRTASNNDQARAHGMRMRTRRGAVGGVDGTYTWFEKIEPKP